MAIDTATRPTIARATTEKNAWARASATLGCLSSMA
jgi:hypothetical protein